MVGFMSFEHLCIARGVLESSLDIDLVLDARISRALYRSPSPGVDGLSVAS